MSDAKETKRQFETQIDIAAPRDAVWSAIATDAGLRRWFAPEASVGSAVGGEVVWEWGGHHRWVQRIEVLEPGTRLRTRYDSAVDDGSGGWKPLFIDFVLEGDGGITTLRLVQSGFGSEEGFDAEYDGISRGWPVELRSLRLYLEGHADKDRRLAWSTLGIDMRPAEAWERLTGDGGFACGAVVESMQEGDPFRFETADGDLISGTALVCHPREFSGDARSHGGAFFRISAEEWGGKSHPWCWLGAYDREQSELSALEARWDAMLERLFAVSPRTTS
jgi:uncharacterized protein YndB with AHSA1/START domain